MNKSNLRRQIISLRTDSKSFESISQILPHVDIFGAHFHSLWSLKVGPVLFLHNFSNVSNTRPSSPQEVARWVGRASERITREERVIIDTLPPGYRYLRRYADPSYESSRRGSRVPMPRGTSSSERVRSNDSFKTSYLWWAKGMDYRRTTITSTSILGDEVNK